MPKSKVKNPDEMGQLGNLSENMLMATETLTQGSFIAIFTGDIKPY